MGKNDKILLFLSFFTLFVYTSEAQTPELTFRHLSNEEGLSSSNVTGFAQTPDGLLWIGTTDGLNLYDGYTFTTYRNEPGNPHSLSDNSITTLLVDHQGELWIGTENSGLNKYNAETDNFTRYQRDLYDPETISNNYITSIAEDANHRVWVGTMMGLNVFDRGKESFSRYFHELGVLIEDDAIDSLKAQKLPDYLINAVARLTHREFPNEHSFYRELSTTVSESDIARYQTVLLRFAKLKNVAEQITALQADEAGDLWIGFEHDGLAHFNPRTNRLKYYVDTSSAATSVQLIHESITQLWLDDDVLWIGTREGSFYEFDLMTHRFQPRPLPESKSSIASVWVDQKGTLWVGNDYGLYRWNRDKEQFSLYQHEENNRYSLSTTAVKAIFEDAQQNLWVGCAQGGINLTVANILFQHYQHNPNASEGLSKNSISSILEDHDGNVWIGYYTMGIDVWNRQTDKITQYAYDPDDPRSLGKGTVFEIFEDRDSTVWIGTYEGGLQQFDRESQTFITYQSDPANPQTLSGNDVRSIDEDANGTLWLAIHGKGINALNKKTKAVHRVRADNLDWQNSLANDWVYQVYVDRDQNIWAGTVFGVSVRYRRAENFVTYNNENSNLSHNNVRVIVEDRRGRIWLGTESGLNLFDKNTRKISVWREKDGLPNSRIHGILEDSVGTLWISTNHGISRFDPDRHHFVNYSTLDGLQSEEFFPGAYYHGKSGAMYVGGADGLTIFYPEKMPQDTASLPVLVTGIAVFDQPLAIDGVPWKASHTTEHLRLEHDQNFITFDYVAINYKNPDKTQYAYQLEGYDREWNYAGTQRSATYSNLGAGDYVFKVKATTNGGAWSNHFREIHLTILPPLWYTPGAYLLYFLTGLGFLYVFKRVTLTQERLKTKLRLQQLEAQKTHELDSLKLNFFANLSHEFRTPLTLIVDPINRLISEEHTEPDDRMEYYQLIRRNTQRLLRLINQLLDISEIEAGVMKLRVVRYDIVNFCKNISHAFIYRASHLRVHFSFESNVEVAEVFFDQDKLEKILFNLISNALKFSPPESRVTVRLSLRNHDHPDIPLALRREASPGSQFVAVAVADEGPGIPKAQQSRVFERFYRVEKKAGSKSGSGIGLALSKQLAERHYGLIDLVSETGGSTFTVWLPVHAGRFTAEETGTEILNLEDKVSEIRSLYKNHREADKRDEESLYRLPVILMVEDSDDVRTYIRHHLQPEYRVREAAGGKAGFEQALIYNPDLIISDVMMPGMDGYELCKKLKTDPQTCHIPVVLLTARSSENHQLAGLKAGADDYIGKPFSMAILTLKIKNILASRQKIREKLSTNARVEPQEVATNRLDEQFFHRLLRAIESRMSDETFNPDALAEMMHLSRSQLYKKIKGLTGLSVSILIRNIRLRRGCALLKTQSMTISEVAYQVGFSDPGYFTKCFREMYSQSPSEYMHSQL